MDDDSVNPAAGIEDIHNMSHDDGGLDDEADCPEDESDSGSLGELNLDELDQGDEYDGDEVEQQPSERPVPGTVRIPPPADCLRNYTSLADEFGETSSDQGSTNEVVETIESSDKCKEGNVRHRTATMKCIE